ncbi:MAG: AAA family ATPase [Chloroflexi bacterium]|nr:AAA family ATPase [Chloroflexota bacterium]
MIQSLEVRNFKSVKQQTLACKRINVLIGEPNTGKSNMLEALAMFSFVGYYEYGPNVLRDFVRFERTSNLFYDEILDEDVHIGLDKYALDMKFSNGQFKGLFTIGGASLPAAAIVGSHDGLQVSGRSSNAFSDVKFYRFDEKLTTFDRPEAGCLMPPSGRNLMSLLLGHRDLRRMANDIFAKYGLKVNVRPQENRIEIMKQVEDITVTYPYSLASDTLKRVIFHLTAILSNKDSILVFEEPESHAFPYYTKQLAETIALDEKNNQYFISTHNPYFLLPLLEKAPKQDVAIFLTYYQDHQTKCKSLSEAEMQQVTEIDIFSNLDKFLDRR